MCEYVCALVCVCACVCASTAAEHTNRQEVVIYLCSVFSHNLRETEQEQKWKKGNKSVRVCLPCWFEMKAHCATSSTLKSEMSLLARPRGKKKSQLSAGVLFSLCFFLSNWNCCFWRDKGGLPLDLNIQELRIDIVKPYLHVYQSHSKRLLLTKLIRWN